MPTKQIIPLEVSTYPSKEKTLDGFLERLNPSDKWNIRI